MFNNIKRRKPVEITVELKLLNSDEYWANMVDVKPGDVVRFRIRCRNTSRATVDNIIVRDILPNCLEYIEGSTTIANDVHPSSIKAMDGLVSLFGLNVGSCPPSSTIWLYFNAKVIDPTGICTNSVRLSADFPNSENENRCFINRV